MRLSTPYDLQVPDDASAQVSSEGLLGPEYIDINIRQAAGSLTPIMQHRRPAQPSVLPIHKGMAGRHGKEGA